MTTEHHAPVLTGEQFVEALDQENRKQLEVLGQMSAAGEVPESLTIDRLLLLALKNELEASEIAAFWMGTTTELDAKLALARQAGDEAKHYRWIVERLERMGVDTSGIDPRASGYSPMFEYLRQLQSTTARVAAGQFTREAVALVRNECFIEFCRASGDEETATLYEEIQRDEQHHHELGRSLLARYAVTEDEQRIARQAAQRTLELAEEIQEAARLKAGICRAPGC